MGALAHSAAATPEPAEVCSIIAPMGGVAVQPDGRIVVSCGCALYAVDTASGMISLSTSGAFRFHPDGTLDRSFRCNVEPAHVSNPMGTHLAAASDGRLLLTGPFYAVDGKSRPGYAMLLPDGGLDDSFQPWRGMTNAPARNGVGAALFPVALLTNGCVAVPSSAMACRYPYPTAYLLDRSGRYFPRSGIDTVSNDWPRARMLMLTPSGFGIQRSVDWSRTTPTTWTSWPPTHRPPGLPFPLWGDLPSAADVAEVLQATFEEVPIELCRYAVRLPDGGAVLAVQGTNGSRLMRFDGDWRPDLSFTNSFETHVHSYLSLVRQPDGKLLLAGELSKLNGEPFPGLARLLPDGSTDRSFRCAIGGDARVMGVARQEDGRILIVGFFSEVNGVKCPHLARLNSDGSLDDAFQRHFTSYDGLNAWRRVPVQTLAATRNPTANSSAATPTALATNTATTVATEPQTVLITSLGVTDGVALIHFRGNPSQTYVLQCRDALDASTWTSIATNRTDAAGAGLFRDEGAKDAPVRFYRVASPQ